MMFSCSIIIYGYFGNFLINFLAMLNIYSYDNPVNVIRDYAENLPSGQKRGIFNRMAQAAQIFPSYLSQILKGDRQLSLDQAAAIAEFMQLSSMETKFFLRLNDLSRAQTHVSQRLIKNELKEIRENQNQISKQIPSDSFYLGEAEQARFYSSWIYAAVRTLCAIPGFQDAPSIAFKLGVPEKEIRGVIEFLLQTGLCKTTSKGLDVGPAHMHLDHLSPHINAHHANWRRRAMENHLMMDPDTELAMSACLTLTKEDALRIRNLLLDTVKKAHKISRPSEPEVLYSLNIDWLEV